MSTRIDEIADGIFRINTPIPAPDVPGGFTFNQFPVLDDEPLLYHTVLQGIFPTVCEALERVLPIAKLRYLAFSHFEADECGALNQFLEAAPDAVPLCGEVAAMISVDDFTSRPARRLRGGDELVLGRHRLRWLDTPHLPHAWDCGHCFDATTATLFCGDLLTQGGHEHPPITESGILVPSEQVRAALDYYSHSRHTEALLGKLGALHPSTLACRHGASWRGDGTRLLEASSRSLTLRKLSTAGLRARGGERRGITWRLRPRCGGSPRPGWAAPRAVDRLLRGDLKGSGSSGCGCPSRCRNPGTK